MRCAICGASCPIERHYRYSGLAMETWRLRHPDKPWTPQTEWVIAAPLYFAPTQDGRGVVAGFCSAAHAAEWYALDRARKAT